MAKLKTLLFVLITLHTITAKCQHNSSTYKNQVKVSPFRLLDPVHSGIEISYERKHAANFSAQFSATYFIKNNFAHDYEDYKGYRFGIEEKYFFPYRIRNIYLSAEAVYQKNSFNTIAAFDHDSTATTRFFTYSDSIKIKRRAAIINVRTGRQFKAGRFVADISIGIGVRFRKVVHEGKIYPGDKLPVPRHPNIPYEANREKNDAAFNLPMNIRIGFMF